MMPYLCVGAALFALGCCVDMDTEQDRNIKRMVRESGRPRLYKFLVYVAVAFMVALWPLFVSYVLVQAFRR